MKMHKRLLNKHNLGKLSQHQGFVNLLTSNLIAHNAKCNVFLFHIFRPFQFKKYNHFQNLQFEFGLPLFFFKILRIIPSKHQSEIQLQNNSVTYIHFINYINNTHKSAKNIQTIHKHQHSLVKPEKLVSFFHKSEQNQHAPEAWKRYSESRQQNQPVETEKSLFINNLVRFIQNDSIPGYSEKQFVYNYFRGNSIFDGVKRSQNVIFNQQLIETRNVHLKQTDSAFQIHRHSISTHFKRMPLNPNIFITKAYLNRGDGNSSTSEDITSRHQREGNIKALYSNEIVARDGIIQQVRENPIRNARMLSRSDDITFKYQSNIKALNSNEIMARDGIILRVKENTIRNAPKISTLDYRKDKHSIIANRKTIMTSDILTKVLRASEKPGGFQKLSSAPINDGLRHTALQQRQTQSMKSASQSFIAEGDLPDLIHRKPAEPVNEIKNEPQITTAGQHSPLTMMKPQGIIEYSSDNQGVDIEHLTGKIMDLLEQRLKTEQERLGIFI